MEIVLCDERLIEKTADFYDRTVLYLNSHVNYPKWKYKVYPSVDSVKGAVRDNTQYVCIDNGEIVGAFVLNDDPQGNYGKGNWSRELRRDEVSIIHAFATLPRLQNKGLGGKILEHIIKIAKDKGIKALRLDIVPDNVPAKRLYEKHGFKYAGEYDLCRGYDDIPTFCLYELNL